INLGLVARTTRASRALHPDGIGSPISPALSEAELRTATALREQGKRKVKMARLLGEGGLTEEARTALLESILPLGRALAIEQRIPEPTKIDEALLGPLAWGGALRILRQFVAETGAPWAPVCDCLAAI
ncbi:MAG TPA: hypothetical protein VHI52_09900, partial [Verrucomicrobiae bacterium]|nr:hypothetical protein [Verrucomicrobiae bacterium]